MLREEHSDQELFFFGSLNKIIYSIILITGGFNSFLVSCLLVNQLGDSFPPCGQKHAICCQGNKNILQFR